MAKSSFFGGTGVSTTNTTALESSTAAAAASESAAAASATSAASSASSAASNVATNAASAAASEASRVASVAAKTASETAETNAETAESAALVSKNASAASAVASESSKVTSVNSASTATTKASEASTSETNAAASAATATTKASDSETARAASVVAKDASVAAKDASVVAKDASVVAKNASVAAQAASETAETNSETAETNAASSASSASTSASTATTKASEASTSATASETSKVASEAAKDAALAALDSFDDRYLGQKSVVPTVDNDGDALASGMLYFNTTTDEMKVYDGSQWLNAYASLSGALLVTSNLSDLNNAGTARTNLGLGTAATTAASAYATAAQGTKVDGIEDSATADQTNAEIRTAVEAATDSNVFTDADHTKLNAIEASATADQTGAEIKTAYEAETNAFTDAQFTKLGGIEALATVTNTTSVTAAGALMNSELTAIASVKALNQGVATTDDPTFTNTQLAAIAQSKSDTAVDVFVYDTSKDSDGGAWRNRTQGTSWYNETLNTSTRGANKKFPSVAVIVAEDDVVTIYDGDAPDMPMWMVFSAGSYTFMAPTTRQTTCVAMLNGILCIGRRLSAGFLAYTSFVADTARAYSGNVNEYRDWLKPISDRNATTALEKSNSAYAIVNDQIKDVAMTVLPNAPIDADTGLPVPTIAVSTGGGVSVIKDDGAVVDITSANGWVNSGYLTFDQDNYIVFQVGNTTGQGLMFRYPVPPSDRTVSGGDTFQLGGANIYSQNFPHFGSDLGGMSMVTHDGSGIAVNAKNNSTQTLVKYWKNDDDYTKSSVAYINSDYNTGWMNGDIKLATLSDTDTTNVTGSELVTNGTFASNTTGWTAANSGVLSVDSARLKITNGIASAGRAHQAITVVVGKTYTISVEGITGTSGPNIRIGNAANGADYGNSTANGVSSFTITPTQTTIYITLKPNSNTNGNTALFDNVSVRLAEEDRSVNNNGLQVFGTVTKTAVATGADLVGYSGFTSSNYLQQPNGLGSQIGTSDFSYMGWINRANTSGTQRIIVLAEDASNARAGIYSDSGNNNINFYTRDGGSQTNGATSSNVYSLNTWVFITCVRRGTRHEIYINGILTASFVGLVRDLSSTTSKLTIGAGDYGSGAESPFNGSLALWRISATAPTAEQIAKMYNDEKYLFQENAQATLYGTSDAVTALAYDDDTELLHAGTSAGRSVFQGLRRVSNTTDAVGAAISASNDLVVEE